MILTVYEPSISGATEVVSLTAGKNGRIYGGFTGLKNHLFFEFDPKTEAILDLGNKIVSSNEIFMRDGLPFTQKIHHSLSTLPDGRIAGGTGQNTACGTCHRKVNEDEGGHIFVYEPADGTSRDLGVPIPHMWIICSTISPDGETLYGMTYLHNDFFAVNFKTGETTFADQLHGALWGDCACCHTIICDREGVVYGSCSEGYLFTFDPSRKELVETNVRLPGDETRRIDSLTLGDDGLLYGGTWETGIFFSIEPRTLRIREICRPNNGPRLPALVCRNGIIYGAAGGGSQYGTRGAFLFEYNPHAGKYSEIGPIVDRKAGIEAQRIHTMTVGLDGRFYAGETGATTGVFSAGKGDIQTGNHPYMYVIDL